MAEKLQVNKFSLAASATMGLIYLACIVFVMFWPNFALQLFGWLMHLVNVDKFAGDVAITFIGALIGLVQVLIYTYVGALLFGWLHNKFMGR